MDNLIVWNIRGMNSSNKHKEVLNFCQMNNAGFIGLVETKVREESFPNVVANFPE